MLVGWRSWSQRLFDMKLWDGCGHWKEVFSTLLHSVGCLQEGFVEEYNGFLEVAVGPCWSCEP